MAAVAKEASAALLYGVAGAFGALFLIETFRHRRKQNQKRVSESEVERILETTRKMFFKEEGGSSYFYLGKYRKDVNALWHERGEWPMNHTSRIELELEREQARKVAHQLIALALDRPEIFHANDSRAILAARAFVLGHYLGVGDKQSCETNAFEYFKRAFELDPTNYQPFSDFGSFLYELKRYDEGISVLARSIELGDDRVHFLLGVLYFTVGNLEDARDCVQIYLDRMSSKSEPQTTMARYFLDRIDKQEPNFDLVSNMYQQQQQQQQQQ